MTTACSHTNHSDIPTNNNLAMDDGEEIENLPTTIDSDAEEQLIICVSERLPLYNYRLPLIEKSKAIVKRLWEDIISEMNGNKYLKLICHILWLNFFYY